MTAGIDKIMHEDIPAVFEGGKDMFVDSVVGELKAHYSIIHQNKASIISQVEEYAQQVHGVTEVFDGLDQDLGLAIASQSLSPLDKKVVPEASTFDIPTSTYLERNLYMKDIQVATGRELIKASAYVIVSPTLTVIEFSLVTLKTLIEGAIFSILFIEKAIAWSPIGLITDLLTDYMDRLRDAVQVVTDPLYSAQETIENLIDGIKQAQLNLPDVINYFEKYIDIAIFTPRKYRDVQLYNISSVAILTEMELVFKDIVMQLSRNRARAIEGTIETADSITKNLRLLTYDIEKGTL